MKVKDHFLSQETFEVKPSKYTGILQTTPKPATNKLSKYYDSPEYISHQTKAKSLKDKIYQQVKSFMIDKKKKMVLKHHQKGNILDIGAGTGDFLDAFDNKLWTKYSIEPSEKLHSRILEKGIHLRDSLNQFEEHSLEVITLWHSLEHIPDLDFTINYLNKILKPNGVILIAVPNYLSYDAKFYDKYWAAWDVPRHLWHFSKFGLKSIFSKYNFKCIKQKGLPFDAFYVSLLSENYKPDGSKIRSFFVGLISNLKALINKEHSSIIYVLKPNKHQKHS